MSEYIRWPSALTTATKPTTEVLTVDNVQSHIAPITYIENYPASLNSTTTSSSSSSSSQPSSSSSSKLYPSVAPAQPDSSSTSSTFSYYHPSYQNNTVKNSTDEVTSIFLSVDGKFEKIDLSKGNYEIFQEYLEKLRNNVNLNDIATQNHLNDDSQELWVVVKPCDLAGGDDNPASMYKPAKTYAQEDEKSTLVEDDDDGFVVVQMEHFQQSLGELVADVLYEHYHPKKTLFNRVSSKISSKFVTVNVPPPHELRALLIRALSESNSFTSERVQTALTAGKYVYFTYGWTSTIYWLARQPWISGIVIASAAKLADCALMLLL